jgi:IclR family KDG regulon transcriptional repressor
MKSEKTTKEILSLEKALNIIEIMANYGMPMRLQDIATSAEIPSSTALRLIYTLQKHGYINQEPASSRYYLSLKFFNIGSQISENLSIANIARPHLNELAAQVSRSVNLAISEGHSAIIVEVFGGSLESHIITTRPGRLLPMHCTALGRSLMIDYTKEQLDEYFDCVPLLSYTPLTITTPEQLYQELDVIKKCGYAYDPGEFRAGICGVAAPILSDHGHPVASISIAELSSVITLNLIQEFSEKVIQTANKISSLL